MAPSSAEVELSRNTFVGTRRSDQFLEVIRHATRVSFVSHVQPDPDSLGSMAGLAHLVQARLGLPTRMTQDGCINRAENRALVRLLGFELTPVDRLKFEPSEAVVMVDSQPKTGRHSFGDARIDAVIDHHRTPGDLTAITFTDIRPSVGATCTIVTRYLIEQNVPVPAPIATALLYGIETETSGYPREATALDDGAMQFLFPLADKELLAQIRNAELPRSHYDVLFQALQTATVYDRLVLSWVDCLPQPEFAAEVVDFLIRYEQVDWALCGGTCDHHLILSLRASLPGVKAGEILRGVVGSLGKAGGHDRRAGGFVTLPDRSPGTVRAVREEITNRIIRALNFNGAAPQPLLTAYPSVAPTV